jgi:acyl-CoA reductase-like NAD-dependent aldehyde dehydrogenase
LPIFSEEDKETSMMPQKSTAAAAAAAAAAPQPKPKPKPRSAKSRSAAVHEQLDLIENHMAKLRELLAVDVRGALPMR